MAAPRRLGFSDIEWGHSLKTKHSPETGFLPLAREENGARPAPETARKPRPAQIDQQPPNLGKPVKVNVPDFSDPNRPKTCLEVDFPIVPINALSALEGNAGKPIYQMSKWWAGGGAASSGRC